MLEGVRETRKVGKRDDALITRLVFRMAALRYDKLARAQIALHSERFQPAAFFNVIAAFMQVQEDPVGALREGGERCLGTDPLHMFQFISELPAGVPFLVSSLL